MAQEFFFYDLETSGFSPREDRIMQFAGIRTNLELEIVGKPVNELVKLSPDVLPQPSAILLTRITPQQTLKTGLSEADFLKYFYREIALAGTIFVGFNSVRFDDEFMRFINYRNFYDAYEWQWKDGRSRWDLLDVVRMTRALRPEGIKWPTDDLGRSTNTLVKLASLNKLDHVKAHDALSDVEALIGLARLIKQNQPKLFDFLLEIMRDKNKIEKLINEPSPFVYTSGKYESQYEHTAVVAKLVDHPKRKAALVFDLRYDPSEINELSVKQLIELWRPSKDGAYMPIKTLQYNRCPAIAPLSVFNQDCQDRLKLKRAEIDANFVSLNNVKDPLSEKVLEVINQLDETQFVNTITRDESVDGQLYNGFFEDNDRKIMAEVRSAKPEDFDMFSAKFKDRRLKKLLSLYKARNYSEKLSEAEDDHWRQYIHKKFSDDRLLSKYLAQLQSMMIEVGNNKDQQLILKELEKYAAIVSSQASK